MTRTADPSFNEGAQSEQQQSWVPSQAQQESGGFQLVNVGSRERWISGCAGALLGLYGLRRLGLSGLIGVGLGAMLLRRATSGHCTMYQSLGLNTADEEAQPEDYYQHGIHVQESFTINKPSGELYAFWHKLENLPTFMWHLKAVRMIDETRSHWVAKGPAGVRVEWDAEIINDEPDRLISWRSLQGADVDNAGTVQFYPAPGGQGTEVRVTLDYIPPGGKAGSWLAKLFGRDADQMIREDLKRFKQLMETGKIARTEHEA